MLFENFWFNLQEPENRWKRDGSDLVLEMDLPGYTKEEVHVTIGHGELLRVKAENKQRGVRSAAWQVKKGDIDNVKAELDRGVLTIRIPKEREEKAREVKIE